MNSLALEIMTKKVINFFSWGAAPPPEPPFKVGCCRSLRRPDWNSSGRSAAVAASMERSDRGRTAVGRRLGRGRTAVGPQSDRGRTAVGPRSDRGRTAIGPRSGRGRTAVGPRSGRGQTAVGPRPDRGGTAARLRRDRGRTAAITVFKFHGGLGAEPPESQPSKNLLV